MSNAIARLLQPGALALAMTVFIAGCSGASHVPFAAANQGSRGASKPALGVAPHGPLQLYENRFSAAQGKPLTPDEIGSYIDPSVTGSDRALALQLMEYMPSNLRGDFVYMFPAGRLMSNNPELLKYASATRPAAAAPSASARPAVQRAAPMLATDAAPGTTRQAARRRILRRSRWEPTSDRSRWAAVIRRAGPS